MLWPNNKRAIKWLFFSTYSSHTHTHTQTQPHMIHTYFDVIRIYFVFILTAERHFGIRFYFEWHIEGACVVTRLRIFHLEQWTEYHLIGLNISVFSSLSICYHQSIALVFFFLLQPITNTIHRYLIKKKGSINQYRINKSVCVGFWIKRQNEWKIC